MLTAGGGWGSPASGLPDSRSSGQIFSPPYLSFGFRPRIQRISDATGPTENIAFGSQFTMTVAHGKDVDAIVLLRPAAITHNFDADKRYIELIWTSTGWNDPPTVESFTVNAPTDDLGPPGYYTIWVVEHDPANPANRAPSVAKFIRLF